MEPIVQAPIASTLSKSQEIVMDEVLVDEEAVHTVHVEVRLKRKSTARMDFIKRIVWEHLQGDETLFVPGEITGWERETRLGENVDRVVASETTATTNIVDISKANLEIHVYQAISCEPDELSTGNSADDVAAATVIELPCIEWDSLWDSLVYEGDVKPSLLNYLHATFLLSEADIDCNLVAWNRIVLLHGPPGTGKTSLCKALAQKLSIRLSERYSQHRLLEVNSHSLFSKWFSESGKLVQQLFSSISTLAEDEDLFLVVLIDEVESLTAARAGAVEGREPSDALRVVNALLTQLDRLRQRKNVLVLATSNLAGAIDPAFRDRADIVQYIGLPPTEAIYDILHSCLLELQGKGVVQPLEVPNRRVSDPAHRAAMAGHREWDASGLLWTLSEKCKGLSGRTLRRLPVLAHARALAHGSLSITRQSPPGMNGKIVNGAPRAARRGVSVERWVADMGAVVAERRAQLDLLG